MYDEFLRQRSIVEDNNKGICDSYWKRLGLYLGRIQEHMQRHTETGTHERDKFARLIDVYNSEKQRLQMHGHQFGWLSPQERAGSIHHELGNPLHSASRDPQRSASSTDTTSNTPVAMQPITSGTAQPLRQCWQPTTLIEDNDNPRESGSMPPQNTPAQTL